MRWRGLPGLLVVAAILLLALPSFATFYTDWLWFTELGYEAVFLRKLNAQAIIFGVAFVAVFVALAVNLRIARQSLQRPHIVFGTGVDGRTIALEGDRLIRLGNLVAVGLALLVAFSAANNWLAWLSFFNATPFGYTDPLFGHDAAFYIFRLPVLLAVQRLALATTILALIGCGLYYVLSGSFVIETRHRTSTLPRLRLIPLARRHLGVLVAIVFALLAWSTWLDMPGLLLTPGNTVHGASYADWHARLPFLWIGFGVLVLAVGLALLYGFGRRNWPLPLAIALHLLVTVSGGLYAGFVQRFVVTPNEQDKERSFIEHNIAATRRAYALDRVEERELSGDAELTADDIIENAATVANVRLWDNQPLLQTFAQIQEIRPYYDFIQVDNDRYVINGRLRQVMLSVRELNNDTLPNRSWVNEHLIYTHGYGLTLGPVNEVTPEGLPVLFIRDLPPVSTVDLPVTEPSVYYGEMRNEYVIVRTTAQEFHYPRGDTDVRTYYEGRGGVPLTNVFRRMLFALRFTNANILVSAQIRPESRIMFRRTITERVGTIAPFLVQDRDPYPVVSDGRLFWILDTYTTSANFPFSTPTRALGSDVNYVRNSVKVVVDAYNGTTTFYVAEPDDPLAATLGRIFPGLLRPMSDMPPDLRRHIRYPEDLFSVQASVFATFHMTDPLVFYNKEDQWQVPVLGSEGSATPVQPYYTIMRLPGEHDNEFIQMLPFTPRAKDNLAAWMVARSDPDHYGKLLAFRFPKQRVIPGPRQVIGRMNQDEMISPQITLWSQQGSQVIWGTLLVIPVNESLLYVRPLYLQSPQGRIPELKRVLVAYQTAKESRIVMHETLVEALAQIFGRELLSRLAPDRRTSSGVPFVKSAGGMPPIAPIEAAPAPAAGVPSTVADIVKEMQAAMVRGDQALRDGDLGRYQQEMKRVRALIEQLAKTR
jgi:uncharacterized membrane protein (UPF0182 family)